jgi:leucyl/phenylalanyl-tRNA--protein transferase
MRPQFGGRGLFHPEEADEHGLVAVGGTLSPELLLEAYASGVFPWSSVPLVTWWSPDPRAIFDLTTFRVHRSAQKRARKGAWRFAVDRDFVGVMHACAEPTPRRPESWITDDFVAGYSELHRRDLAHSVEVYERDELIGGLYGVALGGFFGGESMFHRRTGASQAALGFLVERLQASGFVLLDGQAPNPHLASLGAVLVPRARYLHLLRDALAREARFTPA